MVWYFDNSRKSNCGNGKVKDCQMFPALSMAVLVYDSADGEYKIV